MLPTLLLALNIAAPCESLLKLALPETIIVSANLVPAGPFTPATGGGKPIAVAAACRVVARMPASINFEVWLPVSGWNGKFQAVGGGGFAGVISYGAMATALNAGYATASTDTGHVGANGVWAMNRLDLIADYGYRAIHEMTVKSKAIVEAFYGNGPRLSYFVGCSTGGRQGLMEAQRYPADYDGIVAGAPANYFTHLTAGNMWTAAATLKDEATRLSTAKLAALHQGAIAACDARDGVSDGVIEAPQQCPFDPAAVQCAGDENDSCLTAAQVGAARKIYGSAMNSRTNEEIFPGMPPGSELTWGALAGGPQPLFIPLDFYKYFVHSDPNWDWKTMNFDQDVVSVDARLGPVLNAIDPNLRAFKARGGKLIMYHGWNDQLISPINSVNYFTSVTQAMGATETADFARLFMVPGMLHCAGGPGPNTFNAVAALEQWVEKGAGPAQLIASRASGGVVERTRPLCPYPQVAGYNGSGSVDEAANFVCR